jgi:hypothetical protein
MRGLSYRSLPTTKSPPASTTSTCAFVISSRMAAACPSRTAASFIGARSIRSPHFEIAAELDVGAAPGHVGGDRHRAGLAGLGDDIRPPARDSARSARCGDLALLKTADSASAFRCCVPTSTSCFALLALQHVLGQRVVFLARRAVDLFIGANSG